MKNKINHFVKSLFIVLLLKSPLVQAQTPAIVGLDHVGINVPDLEQGVKFFHDMFGFEPVTKLGPFKMDKNWKKNFNIHENAGEVTIIMMRAGNGTSLELFGFTPTGGSKKQPYRDDLSAYHLSLYTSDIVASKAYLESRGIKFLTSINQGDGDTDGESWVYFETPWGATIELNSSPNGKGYEKNHPNIKLWKTTSALELTTTGLDSATLQTLIAKQIQVWNEKNAAIRLEKMKAVYSENIMFFDHETSVYGIENLNDRITKLQNKLTNYEFSLIKMDNIYNMVRYYWNYGPSSDPKKISGMDLFTLEGNKIRSLTVFIDNLPSNK